MMRRDREARGDQYVNEEYPKRVQCCIPIVVHPDNAFDVSVRQTPEMRRENKPPGTNLANVELNPPGETRHRTCVVIRNGGRIRRLRSSLKDNHLHAQGDLLTRALRLAAVLMNLGKFRQARDLQVRVMRSLPRDSSKVSEQQLEEERQRSLSLLGSMYKMQHKMNLVAALVCTTLLTGIAYKREVDEEMNIVLLALPLILLALMPLLALIFLQVFVLLNRVKFRLKKSRRGTDRNVALDQVKVSKLLG
eukprot:g19052.t1